MVAACQRASCSFRGGLIWPTWGLQVDVIKLVWPKLSPLLGQRKYGMVHTMVDWHICIWGPFH